MKIRSLSRWTTSVEGYIHSVETLGTVDGPGVRYVIFTQGCPLRCLYCHNPDSISLKHGRLVSSASLLTDIENTADFLRRANGGVTLTGGEPLAQAKFTAAILRGCKEMNLHTALDTSGLLGNKATDAMLADTDLVLLDIKSFDPATYERVTGAQLQPTLDFAHRLDSQGKKMWIRFVLVPGLTDAPDNVKGLADFVATLKNVERVEVAPFHKLGEFKWKELGLRYALTDTESPTLEQAESVRKEFSSRGICVV
jgi:pyruvate formate lyase activating enzyme